MFFQPTNGQWGQLILFMNDSLKINVQKISEVKVIFKKTEYGVKRLLIEAAHANL